MLRPHRRLVNGLHRRSRGYRHRSSAHWHTDAEPKPSAEPKPVRLADAITDRVPDHFPDRSGDRKGRGHFRELDAAGPSV